MINYLELLDCISMSEKTLVERLKSRIAIFHNFPKPNVVFKDIFPLLAKPSLLPDIIDAFYEYVSNNHKDITIDAVVGLDARGFLFGPLLASKLNASFVPLRKKGKLPGEVIGEIYSLEYGEAALEIQVDAIKKGHKVIIIDDLLATGGTMACACNLLEKCKAEIIQSFCVIELTGLNGVKKLPNNVSFFSLVQYEF